MQAPVTTDDIHQATGMASGKLAIWWFLASEIVTFGGLVGSYIVVRLANPHWGEESAHLNVAIATFNTFILLTSSLTMVLAFEAIDYQDQRAARTWLGYTVLGGIIFLIAKAAEWSLEINHGLIPSVSGFWSFYYAMTGLHGLHVLGGVVVNTILWLIALRGRLQPLAARVEYAGLYWHFVDVVWIFLFPLLYLG